MKSRNRILTALMSAALMIMLLPAMVFAEGETLPVPQSAEWNAHTLRGVVGSSLIYNIDCYGSTFTVTYDNGSTADFSYDETTRDFRNENVQEGFYPALVDENIQFREGWNKDVKLRLSVPYVDESDPDKDCAFKEIIASVDILCAADQIPLSAEFVPAAGFKATCVTGYNYITEDMFYGEGNAFRVRYLGWDASVDDYTEFTSTFWYAKGKTIEGDTEEGFFRKGRVDDIKFTPVPDSPECYLSKGSHNVSFTYTEYVAELDKAVTIPFNVVITANKYDAYTNIPVYTYTGKVIKPKFKVYNTDDKLIPASAYTYKMPKNSKMGWYTVEIKFKDKNKYVDSITASYGIGPAAPKLITLVSRKGGLGIRWKDFTSTQLKNADGMYIEVSTDKYFLNNYKRIKIPKKSMRNGYRVVKKLKKNRKYYVRAYTYKNIKQKGVKFPMYSADSNTVTGKTK